MANQTTTATFNGTQDSVAVSWTAMPSTYGISFGLTVSDGNGPVVPWTTTASRTSTGCTVYVSGRFTGTVELIIYDT